MTNVLSQSEIDELLNSLNSGEDIEVEPEQQDEAGKVKEYDFRTANRFPKEQIRTLNVVFDNFAQLLASHMTGKLRTLCDVEVLSVEEISFNEFNNSLPTPVVLALINMPPLDGSIIMELSPEVGYAVVDRLFGGDVGSVESNKNFTEIELVIIERFIRQFLSLFVDAWTKVIKVEVSLDRIETSPQFAQTVPLNEAVACITMNVTIGEASGLINICLPHVAIEPVDKQLSTRLLFSGIARKVQKADQKMMQQQLEKTQVNMQAMFNETLATVGEVLSLQIGDVIQINQNVSEPVLVKVEHIPKFKCVVGTKSSRYAVQVIDIIKEENADE